MSSTKEPNSEKDEKKSVETVDTTNVHSANSWESVDLGDDERRKKFLRLMGASKKEHHGRFVIGDRDESGNHGRAKEKTDALNKDLENQYNYSQEHKITRFSHTGLGFEEGKKEEPREESKDSKDKPEENKDSEPSQVSSSKDDRKRESTDTGRGDQSPPKKPKMMMAFVKASD